MALSGHARPDRVGAACLMISALRGRQARRSLLCCIFANLSKHLPGLDVDQSVGSLIDYSLIQRYGIHFLHDHAVELAKEMLKESQDLAIRRE